MLVGDASLRTTSTKRQQRQLCHRCLGTAGDGGAPCTGSDSQNLPKEFCPEGIRVTITFPTCWDGKNTDSADHKSHVAYPASGTFESVGGCPETHPVRLPQLMYEIMWKVISLPVSTAFGPSGKGPLLTLACCRRRFSTTKSCGPRMARSRSFGARVTCESPPLHQDAFTKAWRLRHPCACRSGLSNHGDYVFGWKGDSLQRALNARCNNAVCRELETQTSEEAMKCTQQQTVVEELDGCKSSPLADWPRNGGMEPG